MVELDSYPHQIKTHWSEHSGSPPDFLMTRERTQALDLLSHLICNSSGSIVVCGPEGVGKTTLLNVLQRREMSTCIYCAIEGRRELSLDQVQEHLAKVLKQNKSDKISRSFTNVYGEQGTSSKKIITVIDNAGALAPGVITAIMRHADEKNYLTVIFVLTHDQLHLKYKSDQIIEDCHIVEIAPLSEDQCGKFLQHLSTQSSLGVPMNVLSDSMIADIYRQSDGIPAKIIAELSGLPKSKSEVNPTMVLIMAVVVLVAVALSVQWLSSRQTLTESGVTVEPAPKTADLNLERLYLVIPTTKLTDRFRNRFFLLSAGEATPQEGYFVANSISANPDKKSGFLPKPTLQATIENAPKPGAIEQTRYENSQLTESASTSDQAIDTSAEITAEAGSVAQDDASVWFTSQPAQSYTLQLMVLSKQQSVLKLMEKYPALQNQIRYVRRVIKGKEKYFLYYGAFSDVASANKAKQALPAEFQKSLTRKFGAINKELSLAPTHE